MRDMVKRGERITKAPPAERKHFRAVVEALEGREMLSASPAYFTAVASRSATQAVSAIPKNVNASRKTDNQAEGAIAVNPRDSKKIFAMSNEEFGVGMFAARSTDGGTTWSKRLIAGGSDGLVPALCDPTVAYDNFGNIFIGYISENKNSVELAVSSDDGKTFRRLISIRGDGDQPTVVAGAGSVWVTFARGDTIVASGAAVTALGRVGNFSRLQAVPGATDVNFGDIAIGPKGQVMVTYLTPVSNGNTSVYVSVDPDGRAGRYGFGAPVFVTATFMASFQSIPAQPDATIDAEPGLAYDRSGGVANGRVYLVYTGRNRWSSGKYDTNILLRYSNDNGATWSTPITVNDDRSVNSQFLPRIAADQSTGNVGMSWHDARNDVGWGAGSSDATVNNDSQFFGVVLRPTAGGVVLSPNFQISAGVSNASSAYNEKDYGDYTGLDFQQGVMMPIWADNSNSTRDNPNGKWSQLDMYIAAIKPSFAF